MSALATDFNFSRVGCGFPDAPFVGCALLEILPVFASGAKQSRAFSEYILDCRAALGGSQ